MHDRLEKVVHENKVRNCPDAV